MDTFSLQPSNPTTPPLAFAHCNTIGGDTQEVPAAAAGGVARFPTLPPVHNCTFSSDINAKLRIKNPPRYVPTTILLLSLLQRHHKRIMLKVWQLREMGLRKVGCHTPTLQHTFPDSTLCIYQKWKIMKTCFIVKDMTLMGTCHNTMKSWCRGQPWFLMWRCHKFYSTKAEATTATII